MLGGIRSDCAIRKKWSDNLGNVFNVLYSYLCHYVNQGERDFKEGQADDDFAPRRGIFRWIFQEQRLVDQSIKPCVSGADFLIFFIYLIQVPVSDRIDRQQSDVIKVAYLRLS